MTPTRPESPARVAVAGACGRLGRRVVHFLEADPDIALCGALTSPGSPAVGRPHPDCPRLVVTDDPAQALGQAEVWVEMSLPGPALEHAELAASQNRAILIAATGFSPAQEARFPGLSSRVPLLVTANLSLGVSALAQLCRELARGLDFDVEIVEAHHGAKRDAPSGTALMLARAVADTRGWGPETLLTGRAGATGPRPQREIGIHAVRGGEVVGEHRVLFAGPDERLELVHSAQSRDCFARGVSPAIRFLRGRPPGRYSMDDVWKAVVQER